MKTIEAYILEITTFNGKAYGNTVYISKDAADATAKRLDGEWETYKAKQVTVREISETEGAVGDKLVAINRMTDEDHAKMSGLAKLNRKEREALGL
jgi:hypothetical protein